MTGILQGTLSMTTFPHEFPCSEWRNHIVNYCEGLLCGNICISTIKHPFNDLHSKQIIETRKGRVCSYKDLQLPQVESAESPLSLIYERARDLLKGLLVVVRNFFLLSLLLFPCLGPASQNGHTFHPSHPYRQVPCDSLPILP